MATSKTASFYLTETVSLAASSASGSKVQGTIDIGGLVNIASSEALAIESVDFIYQIGSDYDGNLDELSLTPYTITAQVSDQNPGTLLLRADDNNLVAGGALNADPTNNISSHSSDFYPDNFGKLDEAFMAVNDTLYLVGSLKGNNAASLTPLFVTARIRARIAKLSKQDWMALAITSTANTD